MRILTTVLGIVLFSAVAQGTSGKGGTDLRKLVDQYFEAFNRHDIEALASFYTEDARLEGPEEPKVTIGRDGIKEHYKQFFAMIPDVRDDVKSVIVGDGKVAVEFVSTGTIPSEDGSTNKFELKIASVFEIVDGKIARDATYYDTAD